MAEELRETESRICQTSPDSLLDSDYIATIGDICTLKIFDEIREPELCIIDMKTKRDTPLDDTQKDKMEKIGKRRINVDNKAGTISNDLWASIDEAINTQINTKIVVNGEEDLAALAVISMVKIGAKVIYGMPDKGMVVVDVNQQAKERTNKLLERMLVK